MLEISDSA